MPTETETPAANAPRQAVNNWMSDLGSLGDAPAAPAPAPAAAPVIPPAVVPTVVPAPVATTKPVDSTESPKVEDVDRDDYYPKQKDWKEFRKKNNDEKLALQAERDKLTADLTKVRSDFETLKKEGPSADLEALRKERDELDSRLKVAAVEKHPKFKAYFENKTNAQLELAKRVVGEEYAGPVIAALKSGDSARIKEAIGALEPFEQSQVGNIAMSLSLINQERETEIANAATTYEKMTMEQKAGQERAVTEHRGKLEKVFQTTLESSDMDMFKPKQGDDAWNRQVQQRIESARALIFNQDNTPESLTRAALSASIFPEIVKHAQALADENKRQADQIKALTAATPTLQTAAPQGAKPDSKVHPGSRPGEVARDFMRSLGSLDA